MVAIKAAHIKLGDKDIWPGLPWTWEDTARIQDECRQRAIDKGAVGMNVTFDASKEYSEYMSMFPKYGQRQKIMKMIYPPKVHKPRFYLEDDELRYLAEKLEGVNDPIGKDILDRIMLTLK